MSALKQPAFRRLMAERRQAAEAVGNAKVASSAVAAAAAATPKSPAKTMLKKAANLTRKAGTWLHAKVLGNKDNRKFLGRGLNAAKAGAAGLRARLRNIGSNLRLRVLGSRSVRTRLGRGVNSFKRGLGRARNALMNYQPSKSGTRRSRFGRALKGLKNLFTRKAKSASARSVRGASV
jgi:hypothetical protein